VLLACIVAAQGCLAALFRAARHGRRGSGRIAAAFWLVQGAGVLIKGPVAPLVSGLTIAALATIGAAPERAAGRRLIAALRPWWGIPLAAACVAPWLVALGRTLGWSALPAAMASDILPKLAGAHESHGGPPGLYLLLAPATFWPGSLVALFALGSAWRRRRRPAERFLLAWLVPTWILFECLPTKLPHYVLPTFPALALLSGRAALTPAARLWPPPRHWLARAAFAGWALLAGTVGLALLATTWWLDAALLVRLYATGAAVVAIATAALCVRWGWRVELGRAALAGITGAGLFYALLLQATLPRLDGLWVARGVAAATSHLGARPLLAVGYAEPSLMVASAAPVHAADADSAAAQLAAHPDRLALVSGEQVAAFAAAAHAHGIALRHLATVEGVDYTHGHWVVLQLFEGLPTS
jgi:4-amino-4-deoxy-L-arabinose transferase-like glycosyltransferase